MISKKLKIIFAETILRDTVTRVRQFIMLLFVLFVFTSNKPNTLSIPILGELSFGTKKKISHIKASNEGMIFFLEAKFDKMNGEFCKTKMFKLKREELYEDLKGIHKLLENTEYNPDDTLSIFIREKLVVCLNQINTLKKELIQSSSDKNEIENKLYIKHLKLKNYLSQFYNAIDNYRLCVIGEKRVYRFLKKDKET